MLNHITNTYSDIKNREATSVYVTGSFLINFIGSLTFAVYTVFLYKNGLNFFQMSLMNVIYMLATVILEVPTGAIADMLGRKKTVLLAALCAVVGYFIYPLFSNIYNFALGEVLIALSSTLSYGAFEAWMVKTSKGQGFSGKVDFVFSQASIYSKIASIAGGLFGAYLAVINIAMPFYIGAVLAIFNYIFLAIFMIDDSRKAIKGNLVMAFGEIKRIAVNAMRYSISHKVLLWVILANAIGYMCYQPFNMFWGVRFNNMFSDKIYLLGWLWAIITLFSLGGVYISQYLMKKNFNYAYILSFGTMIVAALIAISASSQLVTLAVSSFLAHEIGRGMAQPVQLAYINRCASEKIRATVLSFESMVGSLGAAIGLVIFGLLANKTSIETAWFGGAILILLAIPLYLKAGRQDKCLV